MVYIKVYTSLLAAWLVAANAAPLQSGVCYSPWHHPAVNGDVVGKDFAQIKNYFSRVRTFHANYNGVNVVDAANAAGLKVAVGIMMNDKTGIAKEIQAACEGVKRYPQAVEAIYVGNENLAPAGSCSSQELVGYIQQIKACTAGTNIPVGTVQRINEWLNAPGIAQVAAVSDKIGTNIYPFFTPGSKTPMEKFLDQYNQITGQYSSDKVVVTETGWPRSGSASPQGNVPSTATTQTFFNEYSKWAENHPQSYYFMMYDTINAYGGGDFETSFGLANKDGQLQIQMPSGNGQVPAPVPAPVPSPGSAYPAPVPAVVPGPAPVPAPVPGPAPGPVPAPVPAPVAGVPETVPAPGPVPAPTPAASTTPVITPATLKPYEQAELPPTNTSPSTYCA